MRSTGLIGVAVVAIVLASCGLANAQGSLQPGLYERTLETDAGDGAVGKHQDTLCISPQEANDIVKTIAAAGAETNCKVSDVKAKTAGKLTFKMACKEQSGNSSYTNEVTYGPDWYTNVSKGKTRQGKISSKAEAKRTGDCPK
jgi:hypothetical protein